LRTKLPYYIELSDLNDFGRLACALEHVPLVSLSLNLINEQILAVEGDFILGRPIMFYVKNRKNQYGEYLAYRVSGGQEEVAIVNYVSSPTFSYSPIINIHTFPFPIRRKAKTRPRSEYKGIRLRDLTSLFKVCAYKSYDEPPIPLLLFEHEKSKKIVIGAATTLSESDDFYCFYYVHLDSVPSNPFVRYSSQKADQPSFSNKLDEHGCTYLKVIKLASSHPLVNLDE
jgi:hypothetical protein